MLTSIADVSTSLSKAASIVIDGSADASSSASSAVAAVTAGTFGALASSWHGIDLRHLSGQRSVGRVILEDGSFLNEWLFSAAGEATTRCHDTEILHFWAVSGNVTGISMPAAQAATEFLNVTGAYWSASGRSSLTASGYIVFEFAFINVTFTPVWANVIWEVLELSIEGEREQILASVLQFVETLPTTNITWGDHSQDLPFDTLYRLWFLRKLRRWGRFCCIWAAAWVSLVASRWGVGAMCFFGILSQLLGLFFRRSARARQAVLWFGQFCLACGSWLFSGVCSLAGRPMRGGRWLFEAALQHTEWLWDYGFHLVTAN